MKFVVILVIVVILTALKREACKTGDNKDGKTGNIENVEKRPCGKVPDAYQFGGDKQMTNQKIIEKISPWTVLLERGEEFHIEYCGGILLEETIVVICDCVPRFDSATKTYKKKVFLAKDVTEDELKEEAALGVEKMTLLKDPRTRKSFGELAKLSKPVSNEPPICLPAELVQTHSQCLIAGWRIEKFRDGTMEFKAEVYEAEIIPRTSTDDDCKRIWSEDDAGDSICVKSDKLGQKQDNEKFAYGPLVCYDEEKDIWSLQGLKKFVTFLTKQLAFTTVFKHLGDIEAAVAKVKKQ